MNQNELIQIKDDIKNRIIDGFDWITNNPEKVICGIGVLTAFLNASKSLVVSHRVNTERYRQDHTYYDSKLNTTYTLRRKLTNWEKHYTKVHSKDGEDVYDILKEFGAI